MRNTADELADAEDQRLTRQWSDEMTTHFRLCSAKEVMDAQHRLISKVCWPHPMREEADEAKALYDDWKGDADGDQD